MAEQPIQLVEVLPTESHQTIAFVCTSDGGCGLQPIELKVYPEPEFNLREYRRERGLVLRDCATLLGLRASEVSGLERGSLRPADGWASVLEVLERREDGNG